MENRVAELRKKANLTQAKLGELVGKSSLTISRIERGEIGLSTRNAENFARALNVSETDLFAAPSEARMIPVVAQVQAGEWAETWDWDPEDHYTVPILREPAMDGFKLFGVEARGPSMNRRYPDGTVLIISDMIETGEEPILGKRYVIERERSDGMREATVKTLWQDDAGQIWLLPESDDPRFQEPIAVDGDEGDTIRVVGRVLFAVMRE
ncbi:LexA family protein [Pararhizobium sp.]|uniref:LexA family protein n=1 Tax=Pararhizobium sp. TaxID=1977563 RepID=UPI003D0986FC